MSTQVVPAQAAEPRLTRERVFLHRRLVQSDLIMKKRPFLLFGPFLLFVSLAMSAFAQQGSVYKWTDENGRVHYGDRVSADRKTTAKPMIVTQDPPPTEAQRAEAQARLEKYRAKLKESSTEDPRTPEPPAAASAAPAASANKPGEKLTCQEAWKRYNDSYACFDPYRYGGGRIRPEAYQHCVPVDQPDPC